MEVILGFILALKIDMKEVQRRITNLKRQFNKTTKVIEKKGRHSKEANAEFKKVGEIFQFLKFSPLISSKISKIEKFYQSHKTMIIKPLDGMGG